MFGESYIGWLDPLILRLTAFPFDIYAPPSPGFIVEYMLDLGIFLNG
jgi:hypothetical protein